MKNTMADLIYPELSYVITGCCFRVHRSLGRFCRERQYADALEQEFSLKKIPFHREMNSKKIQSDSPQGNRFDFIIEGKIILELKAKSFVTKEDYYQMQRYLSAANLKLGMLVNFRNAFLKPQRVLNPHSHS